ncbi:MAG TPA: glycosyltransferase family 39 protein [Gaiellaceae bacterium]
MPKLAPAAAVALVAAAVRIPGVYTHALWQDEVASARILLEPTLSGAVARVARTESTPPLWYVLAWLLHHAGLGIVDVRLLSVAAIGVTAAAACILAQRLAGDVAGVVAGLLVAFGEQFAVYGESLRAYALLAMVAALFVLVLLAVVDAPTPSRLALLALTAASGAYTHYFFALTDVAVVAWLWLEPTLRAVRIRATAAIAGGSVLVLAWATELSRQVHNGRTWWIGTFRLRNVLAAPLRLYTFTLNDTGWGRLLAVVVFVAVCASCAVVARERTGRLVAACIFVPMLVAATAWALGLKVYALRNLIEIAPFCAVAFASAAARLRLPAAAAVVAAGLGAALVFSELHRVPAYDDLAHALLRQGWTPAAAIAVEGDPLRFRAPLEWYLPGRPILVPGDERGRCASVFLVTRDRVVHLRAVPVGATLLGERGRLPRCVRARPPGHAALA